MSNIFPDAPNPTVQNWGLSLHLSNDGGHLDAGIPTPWARWDRYSSETLRKMSPSFDRRILRWTVGLKPAELAHLGSSRWTWLKTAKFTSWSKNNDVFFHIVETGYWNTKRFFGFLDHWNLPDLYGTPQDLGGGRPRAPAAGDELCGRAAAGQSAVAPGAAAALLRRGHPMDDLVVCPNLVPR